MTFAERIAQMPLLPEWPLTSRKIHRRRDDAAGEQHGGLSFIGEDVSAVVRDLLRPITRALRAVAL
jgi:hypothetical protein